VVRTQGTKVASNRKERKREGRGSLTALPKLWKTKKKSQKRKIQCGTQRPCPRHKKKRRGEGEKKRVGGDGRIRETEEKKKEHTTSNKSTE